jgi:hypothetical protein
MQKKIYGYLIIVASLMIVSCNNSTSGNWTTLKFKQTKPIICHHLAADSLDTHGDTHFIEASLMDTSGKVVGQTIGYHIIVDFAGKDGMGKEDMDERMSTMVYRFNEKDAIMVMGGINFNPGETIIVEGQDNYRAIVGGTGIYKGIRGQSIVTSQKDGNIDVVLEFKQD